MINRKLFQAFGLTEQDNYVNKKADISETLFYKYMPEIFNILLLDRTMTFSKKNKNIIWGNDNYTDYGEKEYCSKAQIKPESIINGMEGIIAPQALKSEQIRKLRTKSKAEVFTPVWIVKKQNSIINQDYRKDTIEQYAKRKWLEIACGEAPYIATRYNMDTGNIVPIKKRTGFIDYKLSRINNEIDNKTIWQSLVELAYKSSYGFEWNGDSLLLARENLFFTYYDYYMEKWGEQPPYELIKKIAVIISYNLFQMDGLKLIIPLSEKEISVMGISKNLFGIEEKIKLNSKKNQGIHVKIMNWESNKMEYFFKENYSNERS